jgi:eukaryotic-like serine/threonine-protein kinase
MVGEKLSHYRLVEQIGAGGMGVVYRAYDEELERDVALKVLPAGTLADEAARKRFHKEALALAKLNHPNVATVHEFGHDSGTDFLVTEYIAGITLDVKLATGALPVREVIRLGAQLAQGLSAAHERGVVHRDLKPANLRLTPDGRLKILDFGLAQLMPRASSLGLTATLTQSQEVTGTLPYMAPEQLRGEATDARIDIWAAGAVLYEMATGRRPFPETNGPLLINAILNRDPEPPSTLNAHVSPGLENVILKALDKDPSRRYQSVRELGIDLERLTAGTSPLAKPRSRPPLLAAGVMVVLLVVMVGGYFFWLRGKSTKPSANASVKLRPSVAVLGFKNLAGKPELAWLSTALSEMLTTELAAGEQLRTVPGESVAQMKISLALPEADSFSKETLTKIRLSLGTDEVVLGSYIPLGNGLIRLDLRMQDVVEGETRASVSEKGAESQLDELVSRAGAELRAKLGVGGLSEDQSASVRASFPTNPEAARLYAEGLGKLRVLDSVAARDFLQEAVAAEPNFSLSHDALAAAWKGLGYDAKATEEARKAFELSNNLSREGACRWRLDIARPATTGRKQQTSIAPFSTSFPTIWNTGCSWRGRKPRVERGRKPSPQWNCCVSCRHRSGKILASTCWKPTLPGRWVISDGRRMLRGELRPKGRPRERGWCWRRRAMPSASPYDIWERRRRRSPRARRPKPSTRLQETTEASLWP